MNENWRPEEWEPREAEFQRRQYLGSRSHCARELLEAIGGIGPKAWMGFSPRNEPIDRPACGAEGYVLLVGVSDVRPEVTCPRCRALMRAVRPESAPLHERIKLLSANVDGTIIQLNQMVYFVGGEQVTATEYAGRLSMRLAA